MSSCRCGLCTPANQFILVTIMCKKCRIRGWLPQSSGLTNLQSLILVSILPHQASLPYVVWSQFQNTLSGTVSEQLVMGSRPLRKLDLSNNWCVCANAAHSNCRLQGVWSTATRIIKPYVHGGSVVGIAIRVSVCCECWNCLSE